MLHDSVLKSKVALVTGSTSGIGLEMVHGLALRGADVLLSGFGDEALIETIKRDISRWNNCRIWYALSCFLNCYIKISLNN